MARMARLNRPASGLGPPQPAGQTSHNGPALLTVTLHWHSLAAYRWRNYDGGCLPYHILCPSQRYQNCADKREAVSSFFFLPFASVESIVVATEHQVTGIRPH